MATKGTRLQVYTYMLSIVLITLQATVLITIIILINIIILCKLLDIFFHVYSMFSLFYYPFILE